MIRGSGLPPAKFKLPKGEHFLLGLTIFERAW